MNKKINYRAVIISVILIILGFYVLSKHFLAGLIITSAGILTSLEILRWLSECFNLLKSLFMNKEKEDIIKNSKNVIKTGDIKHVSGGVHFHQDTKLTQKKLLKKSNKK